LDIEVVPGNDHSLYTVDGRADAYPILTRWIESRFAHPAPVGTPVVTSQL
jgi:hypothetical protein